MSRSRITSIKDVWDLVKSDGLSENDYLEIEKFFQRSERIKNELNNTESPLVTNGGVTDNFSGFSTTNRLVNEESQSQGRSLFHYLAEHVPFAEDEKAYADFIQKLMRIEIAREVSAGFRFPFVFFLDSKKQTPLDIALDLNPNPNNVFIRAVQEVINERFEKIQNPKKIALNKRKRMKARTPAEQEILQETLIAHRELGEFDQRRNEKTVANPTLTPAHIEYLKDEKKSSYEKKPSFFSKTASRKNVNLEQLFADFRSALIEGMTEAQFNEFLMKFSGNMNARDPKNHYSLLHYLVFYHTNQCPLDGFIIELIRDFGANPNALYGGEGTSVKDLAVERDARLLAVINKAEIARTLSPNKPVAKESIKDLLHNFENLAKDAERNREMFPKAHMQTFQATYKAAEKDEKIAALVSQHLYKIAKSLVEDKHRIPAYKKEAAKAFKLLLNMKGKNPQLDGLKKEACAYLRKHYRFAKKYDLILLRNQVNKGLGVKAKVSVYEKGHMTLLKAKTMVGKVTTGKAKPLGKDLVDLEAPRKGK